MREGGETYYYVHDHQGAPRLMLDAAGDVVWSAEFDAFGAATVHPTSTVASPWRGSGQYYDAESGLHNNTYRYYDPSLGRYITLDPILEAGGTQFYGFAGNAPSVETDPLGLAPPKRSIGISGWPFGNNGFGSITGCLSAGAYAGVGAEASVCVQYQVEDCCTEDNVFIKAGKSSIHVSGAVEAGIGLMGKAGALSVGGKLISRSYSVDCGYDSDCGKGLLEKSTWECCFTVTNKVGSVAFDIGIFAADFTLFSWGETYCWGENKKPQAGDFQNAGTGQWGLGIGDDESADHTAGDSWTNGGSIYENSNDRDDMPIPWVIGVLNDLMGGG